MAIAFDPKKDVANKKEHDISLSRAEEFDVEAAVFIIDDRMDYGELRIRALGFLPDRTLIY